MSVLVDSSVILDILTNDPVWADRSEHKLADLAFDNELVINDIIWTECSASFNRIEDYREVLSGFRFLHRQMPLDALFLASRAFIKYRKAGGNRTSPLPDFFIGAHAAVASMKLLTRDPRRVENHFPTVEIIEP